jgi:dTDP-3-amino-3,4,6-trideoxy-alpha-D-glucose transaminase
MDVRLNELGRQWADIRGEANAAFERVGASGAYVLSREGERFESALADAWPVRHVVATGNGLDALEIALRCLGVGSGDRVLTTPLSAFASTLALVRVGAVPVFVDVDVSGLVDLDRCQEACARDARITALLVVHLFGHPLDLDRLAALRRAFGLRVVEDCAQSIGASWGGAPTGSVGDVSATSFYPTKNLGGLGDGGAVLTASLALATKARALRHYGQSATYVHDQLGLNSRLDEVHAAVLGDVLLPRLADWTTRRASTSLRYLREIDNPCVVLPSLPPRAGSAWHLFPILVADGQRPSFVRYLRERGVMTGVHYPHLIPDQAALREYGHFEVVGDLLRARLYAESEVSLPIHPFLSEAEVGHVIACCNAWRPA